MTFDEFYSRMVCDLGRFSAQHTATFSMDYDEWLEQFALFCLPDLDRFTYKDEV